MMAGDANAPGRESDLLTLSHSDLPILALLDRAGHVFRDRFPNDSGNQVFGVESVGRRFFVKHSDNPGHVARFHGVEEIYRRVSHPALPPLRNGISTGTGYALVFDWLDTENYAGDEPRRRFASLPLAEKVAAFGTILDLHLRLAEAGLVAEDLYDGCFLYDFDEGRMFVCDLDEYHDGPFILDRDRTFGSTRFMAPEEWVRGSQIDHRTTVYLLARSAAVLLGDRAGSREAFSGAPAMWSVIERATRPDPSDRYQTVAEFADAWRQSLP